MSISGSPRLVRKRPVGARSGPLRTEEHRVAPLYEGPGLHTSGKITPALGRSLPPLSGALRVGPRVALGRLGGGRRGRVALFEPPAPGEGLEGVLGDSDRVRQLAEASSEDGDHLGDCEIHLLGREQDADHVLAHGAERPGVLLQRPFTRELSGEALERLSRRARTACLAQVCELVVPSDPIGCTGCVGCLRRLRPALWARSRGRLLVVRVLGRVPATKEGGTAGGIAVASSGRCVCSSSSPLSSFSPFTRAWRPASVAWSSTTAPPRRGPSPRT